MLKKRYFHPKPKTKPRKSKNFKKYFWIMVLAILVIFLSFFQLSKGKWNKIGKLTVAVPQSSGEIDILTFDPNSGTIWSLTIPENTLLNVARNLGSWPAGSIKKLGDNEKLSGLLVSETITRSLKIPVDMWAESPAAGFASSSPLNVVKALLLPYQSNLSPKDKLQLFLFSIFVGTSDKTHLELKDSGFLSYEILPDGTNGFIPKKDLPRIVLSQFADPQISSENQKIKVISVNKLLAEKVGQIINVAGGSLTLIEEEKDLDLDCLVSSKKKTTTSIKLARVFNCKNDKLSETNAFDIVVKLGKDFEKRF